MSVRVWNVAFRFSLIKLPWPRASGALAPSETDRVGRENRDNKAGRGGFVRMFRLVWKWHGSQEEGGPQFNQRA